ncbi:MAG: hypothetical protein K2N13_04915, partial [Paraprevotella sp.]|nr:hypothetical protein [Paraprevotella sp.]
EIPSSATAPGLEAARERLKLDTMTQDELRAYYRHLDNVVILKSNIYTEREEGLAEGLAKGREEGREEGLAKGRAEAAVDIAKKMKQLGLPLSSIAESTGLTQEEIEQMQ